MAFLDTLMDGIDMVNEVASKMITGFDCALYDISYEEYPYLYKNGGIAMRVRGCVEDVETLVHLPDYKE